MMEQLKKIAHKSGLLSIWWRIRDSNPGPADYDLSLTANLYSILTNYMQT
jgi:hypothetical protein